MVDFFGLEIVLPTLGKAPRSSLPSYPSSGNSVRELETSRLSTSNNGDVDGQARRATHFWQQEPELRPSHVQLGHDRSEQGNRMRVLSSITKTSLQRLQRCEDNVDLSRSLLWAPVLRLKTVALGNIHVSSKVGMLRSVQ